MDFKCALLVEEPVLTLKDTIFSNLKDVYKFLDSKCPPQKHSPLQFETNSDIYQLIIDNTNLITKCVQELQCIFQDDGFMTKDNLYMGDLLDIYNACILLDHDSDIDEMEEYDIEEEGILKVKNNID